MSRVERIEQPTDRYPQPSKLDRGRERPEPPRKAATTPGKAEGEEEDVDEALRNS
jgi:hypothetical protein